MALIEMADPPCYSPINVSGEGGCCEECGEDLEEESESGLCPACAENATTADVTAPTEPAPAAEPVAEEKKTTDEEMADTQEPEPVTKDADPASLKKRMMDLYPPENQKQCQQPNQSLFEKCA